MKITVAILVLVSTLFIGCSREGAIKVKNRDAARTLTDISWGNVDFGDIAPGNEQEIITEDLGTHHVHFTIDSTNYRSREEYTVDAETGATFSYRSSSDAVLRE